MYLLLSWVRFEKSEVEEEDFWAGIAGDAILGVGPKDDLHEEKQKGFLVCFVQ